MSQENVEIIRTLLALWNTGDRPSQDLSDYFRPEIELDSPFASVAGEPYRGYSGIEQWMRDIDEQFASSGTTSLSSPMQACTTAAKASERLWSSSLEDLRTSDSSSMRSSLTVTRSSPTTRR